MNFQGTNHLAVEESMEEMASERTRLLGSDSNSNDGSVIRNRPGYSLGSNSSSDNENGESSGLNQHLHRLTRSLSTAPPNPFENEGSASSRNGSSTRTLGTFMGVFCPVAMSMFSTLLYLRAGFVVGQAGLLETFSQLILAYFILVMTVLSICAISTNGALEGGGAYYMISRALGPEFGGSIGFLFYVANILSCALYTTGFVEGIIQNFGEGGSLVSGDSSGLPVNNEWWRYLYATVSLFICLLICIVGGAMFARTSAIILLIVVVCTLSVMISVFVKSGDVDVEIPKTNDIAWFNKSDDANITGLYTGLNGTTFRENLHSEYTIDYNTKNQMDYATVFAILFSSVTGILNGANMSGELKDPSKAIPKGTLSAVCFTFITYIIMSILIGGSCTRYLLVNDYVFLQQVNVWPPFVVVGIFAATLSAALGNLIGASRVLEALGNDQLFWFILKPATITTKGGNPVISVLISWFLVQCVLLVGSLNAIAPITSVFFLLSYAATNLACLALELASAPNFRPTFVYFSWHTCSLGLLGCMIMCFLISPIYTSIAMVLMLVLVILLHFRSLPTTWGSISQALIFHQVRKYLLMLDPRKSHVKYWRPQILLMVANPRQSCELMDFCNDIKKSGLYVIGHVKTGKLEDSHSDPVLEETPRWLQLIQHMKIKAFVELTLADTVSEGFQHLVRIAGLGGMKVNTVCFGFYDDSVPGDSLLKTRVRKRRFFGAVERGEMTDIESYFDGPRSTGDKLITSSEYVKLIQDALKLQKNVFLCRNFQLLNKEMLLKQAGKSYIDVWPVNFFRPQTASYFDNTCLFMLQLACILSMQNGWKQHTQLRVFLCVRTISENTAVKEKKLSTFLRQLRIQAQIVVVSWEHIQHHLRHGSDLEQSSGKSIVVDDAEDRGNRMNEYAEVPDDYLEAVKSLVQSNSQRAAVTFVYLPRPPVLPDEQLRYMQQLAVVSDLSHPTVLVHGLHPVTSTTL
ncbi:solute carrier family 12 member 9 [Aplysia californica]|uniref:Solute carrier family 12 member 9 n=1 Tax=Aplysia californica TaxID=6500 RepID=A0ABM0JN55_APLCA|nr:solute carrier family 12 member 9 [Aplysia californica]